jgi:hypothetical protein
VISLLEHTLVIYDKNTAGLRLTAQLVKDMPRIIKAMPEYPDGAALAIRLKDFYERITDKTLPAIRQLSQSNGAHDGEASKKDDLIPLHTLVMWHGTSKEVASRKGTSVPQGNCMVVVGHEKVREAVFYRIEPYDDPAKPKRRQPVRNGNAAHLVPRTALTLIETPAAGD